MHFEESERIARTEQFPRSDIEKIDCFLAGEQRSRPKLHDVMDKTGVTEDTEAILNEYVKLKVIKAVDRFVCPEHRDEELKLGRSLLVTRKGYCNRCKRAYPLEGLKAETIYQRTKKPYSWSDEQDRPSTHPEQPREIPFLKDRKLYIGVISGISGALILGSISLYIYHNPRAVDPPTQLSTPPLNVSAEATKPPATPELATQTATPASTNSPTPVETPLS